MLVCAISRTIAHETAGAARTRCPPLPLWERMFMQTSGKACREIAKSYPDLTTSLRGALATKQSIPSLCGAMDCFAEPVIGRRFAPTRWLAMTFLRSRHTHTRRHPRMRVIQYPRDAND